MNGYRRARPLSGTLRWPALFQHFQAYLDQHALSPVTVRNYMADLRAFSRWHVTREHQPATLTELDFRAYREHLCDGDKQALRPTTVNRRLQSLRLFGRFLHETGYLPENPTVEIELLHNGNGHHPSPRTLSSDEIARLMKAIHAGRPSLVPRDYAIVQLLLQAGLRVNEVAALALDDVERTRHGMTVIVHNGRNNQRRVPLNRPATRALRAYLAIRPAIPRVDHLFLSQRGQPLSMRSIQRSIDTFARAAGLVGVSAQSLRHTCAKNMLAETHDAALVAQRLGHTSAKALDRYA